jgi:hypothetical protein
MRVHSFLNARYLQVLSDPTESNLSQIDLGLTGTWPWKIFSMVRQPLNRYPPRGPKAVLARAHNSEHQVKDPLMDSLLGTDVEPHRWNLSTNVPSDLPRIKTFDSL